MYQCVCVCVCVCVCLKLELLPRDTKLQVTPAVEKASILAKRGCIGFIGAWASSPTIEVSKLLALQSIDRVIVGPSAASPQLSEAKFSNFLRTGVSEDVVAKLMINLMTGPLFFFIFLAVLVWSI